MLVAALLFLLLGAIHAQSPLARKEIANPKTTSDFYRLPTNIRPLLYQLEMEPDFDTETFNGSVRITLSVTASTNEIVLHSYLLDINTESVSLLNEDDEVVPIAQTAYSNDDRQFYTITFEEVLVEGQTYVLAIDYFQGSLANSRTGFYLARYINEDGIERKLATTDFQPTSARRAFPCFDEPALKAQFEMVLTRPDDYNSLFNSPKISTEELPNGKYRDTYERTVIMPTYLVAFVVSDFTYVSEINHRVFGKPHIVAEHRMDYALAAGIQILDAIEDFVGIPYTLSKMDQIGLPNEYYAYGAMENWGLVVYREAYLAYLEDVTPFTTKQTVATIIAHEFGHQWFGNLVGPLWWSYLWLNEGFATYFEFFGASLVEPEMRLMDQMLIRSVQYALGRDSSAYTRPMNQDAGSPSEVDALFDVVAYDKAGAVVRMIEGIMTTPVFREALNIYVNKMQFTAAQPTDLYTSLQQALDEANSNILPEGEDMSAIMGTWDSNAGYPLVTVIRNYEDGSVTLVQNRLILPVPSDSDDSSIWYIPISYTTGTTLDFEDTTPKLWLTSRSMVTNLDDLPVEDWLIVNIQERGYYRVNYDSENWYRIANLLSSNYESVHLLNRAQLLDDSLVFAQNGIIDLKIPLSIAEYVARETDYIPLYTFFTGLSFVDRYTMNTGIYDDFRNYVLNLLDNAVNSVGFAESTGDSHVTRLNRVQVMTWVCKYGGECRDFALDQVRDLQQNDEASLPSALESILLCAAMRNGEQSDWDFVRGEFGLISALGCSENVDVLESFLDLILSGSVQQSTALSAIYSNGVFGRDFLYNYIKNNWDRVNSGLSRSQLLSTINGIARLFSSREQLEDLEAFAEEVNDPSLFSSAISTINSNIVTADQFVPSILEWFQEKNVVHFQ